MSVTPEFVKKELTKLEKKKKANETTYSEMQEGLNKAKEIKSALELEEVALRTLAAGPVPKAARPGLAQQLAEIMKVKFDETSIMDIIAKFEKQDAAAENTKPAVSSKKAASVEVPEETEAVAAEPEPASDPAPKRGRGRPKMTDEQKKDAAKQRMLAAAQAAAEARAESAEDYDDDDEEGEELFNPDDFDEE